MTTRFTRSASVLSAALALAIGSMAHAAETRPGDPAGRTAGAPSSAAPATTPPSAAPATTPPSAASTPMASGQVATAQSVRDVRMSELIGMDVRNERGERLGDVNDLVVDPVSGQVAYAVIGAGGFLGIGEKLSAFPMSSFKIARGDARATTATPADRSASTAPATPASRMLPGRSTRDLQLVLNADPKQLKGAPNFDRDQWPDWSDNTFRSGVYRAAGVNAPPVAAAQTGKLVRASELMAADVQDAQNKDIGDIEDLVVDMSSGRVHYAVVEFERGWFESDKIVALPMTALRPSSDKGKLIFSGDRSLLSQAPSFEKTAWPDLNAPTYRGDVERYMATWGGMTGSPPPASAPGATSR